VTVLSANEDRARRLTLAATVLGSALAFVDASVVVVALPTIQDDLHFSLAGEQWVFLAYSLALAALYLPAGAVGDRGGRRETFVAGVVGFALASVLAGLAPTGTVLIAARALQGVAAAFMTTNSLALLRETYGDEAGRAVGLWTAFTSVATLGGPPLGGSSSSISRSPSRRSCWRTGDAAASWPSTASGGSTFPARPSPRSASGC
jgi:MFS family permease